MLIPIRFVFMTIIKIRGDYFVVERALDLIFKLVEPLTELSVSVN